MMMNYYGAAVSDTGTVKAKNQDSLTLKIVRMEGQMACLAVMCDGLGGLSQGEVASGSLVMAFDRWFRDEFLSSQHEWTKESIFAAWQALVSDMNDKIRNYGTQQHIQIGTTLTAVLFIADHYYAIHIGDTRLYELTDRCRQLTQDQSVRENLLLQCVGVTERLIPSFLDGRVRPQAYYLLCSDGFRHYVSAEEMYDVCRSVPNASREMMQAELNSLVELNKQRGEQDNISAILIQMRDESC